MRIHEVIYFTHELDMLEAHLEEHQHFVDKFFIKESACLWSGPSKKLHFDENRDRFSRFNIEPMVIPNSEFDLNIPAQFSKKQFKHYHDIRRDNRTKSRTYRWDDIRRGCDWVMSMDCDEIIDSRQKDRFLSGLTSEYEHVSVPLVQYQYYINMKGHGLNLWRVFRSDVPHRMNVKGRPRRSIEVRIGGHYTNCYLSGEEIRTKALGILTHYGYSGVSEVPSAEDIELSLKARVNPFCTYWTDGEISGTLGGRDTIHLLLGEITPDLDHAPKFMRDNPNLFPVYPHE